MPWINEEIVTNFCIIYSIVVYFNSHDEQKVVDLTF